MELYQDSFQKFFTVANQLADDIVNGLFPYGKPFLSRSEICEKFSISLKTAHKVQQELIKRGLIAANRGRAFTVCNPNDRGIIPLHEIRLLRQNQPFTVDYVMDELAGGIRERCSKKGLAFSEIYLELQDKNSCKINPAGGSDPGQGIVLLPYRSIMCRGAGYFLKYWQPYRATVDFPLPGTSGVMSDEADLVNTVMEHAHSHGARSIMQLPHHSGAWNPLFSMQCFRFGEIKAASLGMTNICEVSPEIHQAVIKINRLRPDALLFHISRKATVSAVVDNLDYQPLLYFACRGSGEEKFCSQIPNSFCYVYDYKKIGIAAVDLMAVPEKGYSKRELVYIKGKLKG